MRRIALFVGLVLVLAGCGGISDMVDISRDIQNAGYRVISVLHSPEGGEAVLSVEAELPGRDPTEEDAETIAEIGWESANGDIDRMSIVVNGEPLLDENAAELTARLGERPPVSERNPGDSGDNTALIVILVITGAFVFVGATVLLYLRSRRRPPPMAPPSNLRPVPPPGAIPPPPPQWPS